MICTSLAQFLSVFTCAPVSWYDQVFAVSWFCFLHVNIFSWFPVSGYLEQSGQISGHRGMTAPDPGFWAFFIGTERGDKSRHTWMRLKIRMLVRREARSWSRWQVPDKWAREYKRPVTCQQAWDKLAATCCEAVGHICWFF